MHMDVCHTHVVYINIYVYGPQPHGHQLDIPIRRLLSKTTLAGWYTNEL